MSVFQELELKREVLYWKAVAAYLASCHAASLEDLPKSSPKSRRSRLVSICNKSASYLQGSENLRFSHTPGGYEKDIELSIQRCQQAAQQNS